MAPKTAQNQPSTAQIPLFYRIYILYIDPLLCLSGLYLCFFDPAAFIHNTIPTVLQQNPSFTSHFITAPKSSPATTTAAGTPHIDPLIHQLIILEGCFFLCIFALQLLLLRQALNFPPKITVQVWKMVMFAILLTDIGIVAACVAADRWALGLEMEGAKVGWGMVLRRVLDVRRWGGAEWGNYGVTVALIVIRAAFVLGIGMSG